MCSVHVWHVLTCLSFALPWCADHLHHLISLSIGARCVSCVLQLSLAPLFLTTYIDARALCQAAGSLVKLKLRVDQSTAEALVEVLDHRPLKDFCLTLLYSDDKASSALSPIV